MSTAPFVSYPLPTMAEALSYRISTAAEHEAALRATFYNKLAKGLTPNPNFFLAAIRRIHGASVITKIAVQHAPVGQPTRHEVFGVACSFCGAAKNQQCHNRVTPHDARWQSIGISFPTVEQITAALRSIEARELALA